jgi:hypothetical protein
MSALFFLNTTMKERVPRKRKKWKRNRCENCWWFMSGLPDEGACWKPLGGRIGCWESDPACRDFKFEKLIKR